MVDGMPAVQKPNVFRWQTRCTLAHVTTVDPKDAAGLPIYLFSSECLHGIESRGTPGGNDTSERCNEH